MRRCFPLLLALGLIVALGWREVEQRRLLNTRFAVDPERQVVLLSTAWCGYCKATRAFLERNRVRFEEYDVERSERGRQLYAAVGPFGVPVVLVDGAPIRGLDIPGLIDALESDRS